MDNEKNPRIEINNSEYQALSPSEKLDYTQEYQYLYTNGWKKCSYLMWNEGADSATRIRYIKNTPAPLSEQKQEGEKQPFQSAEELFNTIAFLDRSGDFFNMPKDQIIDRMEKYAAQFTQGGLDDLDVEHIALKEATRRYFSYDGKMSDEIVLKRTIFTTACIWWQSQHTAKELAEIQARITQLENMLKYARNGYSTLIEYEILNDRYKDDAQVIIDKIESIF
jgi:hypothetical protein